jgi:hypothetical protein
MINSVVGTRFETERAPALSKVIREFSYTWRGGEAAPRSGAVDTGAEKDGMGTNRIPVAILFALFVTCLLRASGG